jgi:hypothetical protein
MDSVRAAAVSVVLLSCAWAQTAGPGSVQVEVVFLEAKTDGSGLDPRINASLSNTLRKSSKGSPNAVAPFDRFDGYGWIGKESRVLHANESAFVPIPMTQDGTFSIEYRGSISGGNSAEGRRHAMTFGPRSKSGEVRNKVDVTLEDGGTFLQGMTTRAGKNLFLGFIVTAIKPAR